MPHELDPALFARIMGLKAEQRADILEYIGGTATNDSDLEKLIADLEANGKKQDTAPN